ncbi:MAG: hypothetical protein V4812_00995 [Pseudomonadota bacterium]
MSPESLILLMITGWFCVAASMLWGMLRVSRRHAARGAGAPTMSRSAPVPTYVPRLSLTRRMMAGELHTASH